MRRPDEVSSQAPADSCLSQGRVDLCLSTSHHALLSSGGVHNLQMLLFRHNWPKLPRSFGSYWKCNQANRLEERQAAHS